MELDPRKSPEQGAIASESDFYQRVRKRTYGSIYWERVEPSNECGFPDTHFVVKRRGGQSIEGTVEFKYMDKPGQPKLHGELLRGTQKSSLLEYHQNGGRRRFFLVYTGRGEVWLYDTEDAVAAVLQRHNNGTALANLEEPSFCAWLISCLTK